MLVHKLHDNGDDIFCINLIVPARIFFMCFLRQIDSGKKNIKAGFRKGIGINMGNKFLDGTALTIAIIGAINWGLIGLFRFDLVAFIFGDMSWFARIVYILVGIFGVYLLTFYMHLRDHADNT